MSVDKLSEQDGLVGADTDDGQWVLTSPNVDYVPEPVLNRIRVTVRDDGWFGLEDPMQWPQYFSPTYSHYALVQRRPTELTGKLQPIWWKPSPRSFVPIHGSAVSNLGTLELDMKDKLSTLVRSMSSEIAAFSHRRGGPPTHINFCDISMRASLNALSFPSTYRDLVVQVANVQRYWLESQAWLDYMNIYRARILGTTLDTVPTVNNSFMGCYTSDPTVAFKLYKAGIPVWLIRAP